MAPTTALPTPNTPTPTPPTTPSREAEPCPHIQGHGASQAVLPDHLTPPRAGPSIRKLGWACPPPAPTTTGTYEACSSMTGERTHCLSVKSLLLPPQLCSSTALA